MNQKTMKKLYIGMAVLVLLTPLGLLASGTAFGEWGSNELKERFGYAPAGVERGEGLWSALMPDYSIPGLGEDFLHSSIGYLLSALVGCVLIYAAVLAIGKYLSNQEADDAHP